MTKKKHRKKARSGKRAEHHQVTKHGAHAKRTKRSKHSKYHDPQPRPEHHHSLPLLRAIKRRRAAQDVARLEFDGIRGHGHHSHKKRGKGHQAHKGAHHHHGEPVITEKSFENMLAYRRFQDHAR